MIKSIGQAHFNNIIEREKSTRDHLPQHTLDWYIYNNRVRLLEEVESLFIKIPDPPSIQMIREGIDPK